MANETILVVEDESLVALALKEDLERLGYRVPEVIEKGEAVVEGVARHNPDLLLMDIRLRGCLDGIEAASLAKAAFDIPVIYLTAYSDEETLRRAAMTSPDGFLLKPFDEPELAANVRIALSRASGGESLRKELRGAMALVDALDEPALIADTTGRVAHANAAARALLGTGQDADLDQVALSSLFVLPADAVSTFASSIAPLRRDPGGSAPTVANFTKLLRSDGREYGRLVTFGSMERRERILLESSAAEANAAMLGFLPGPDAAGPGYLVGGFLDPCRSGSGDLFDVFPAGEGKIAFYGLDVMGHGLVASFLAFSLRDVLPIIGCPRDTSAASPSEVLRQLYHRYCRAGEIGTTFFTIAYGLLDAESGEYAVVRAGHTPVLRLEAGGGIGVHDSPGTAVGIMHEAPIREARGKLSPGDRLLLLSDGLLETFGGEGLLKDDIGRVAAFASSLTGSELEDFVDAFKRRSRESVAEVGTKDDISLLVIERR
jgi:CheY-like chemotaxis protein